MNWSNRKFQYGDGFFETLIVQNGEIRFWNDHIERINYAFETLKLNYSPIFFDILKKEIEEKSIFGSSRIKVQFWRSGEGKYTPESNQVEFYIEVLENKLSFFRESTTIKLCESSEVIPSKYSSFKCFLLPYITAAIEKEDKKVDDLIILNTQGIVAESISNNLFWVKNDVFYTPSLESGCLNGIMRKQILKSLSNQNLELQEGKFTLEELNNADSIFCTNITGITQFKNFNDLSLDSIELEDLFKLV